MADLVRFQPPCHNGLVDVPVISVMLEITIIVKGNRVSTYSNQMNINSYDVIKFKL